MPLPKEEYFTYTDYAAWPDDERYELIGGVPYLMTPAPTPRHQRISRELTTQLNVFLKGKSCEVFPAPFDVRLNAGEADDTVVQPDISIICDASKIDDKGCAGVPDMVIEILSPSTAAYDRIRKFRLYRQYGVKEYWIVDPIQQIVDVHLLKDGEYITVVYADTDEAIVSTLDGCIVNLQDVFGSMVPG